MMICTAGHVDHGKTSLVKLLTGCNTDRLKEEQERGMTIELGFAPCYLGNNVCVGIVDVPGHEKFIKNMVAGVSGIEMTVLVIAADDGIMPQTVEHFRIMELLGVRHGMVALTKIDLVSEERVREVTDQIREFLKGTFMERSPICPISSETTAGFFGLYDVLVERIKNIIKERKVGIFRMPIERVFVQRGFGTVLSGIPVDGTVEIGTEVEIVPGSQTGKVRGIQRFLRDASEGGHGQCLALNIPDLKKSPERGQVVCLPGYLRPATIFHITVRAVPGLENPIRNAEQIKFHTGTSEEIGKIYLLEDKTLGEGQTGLASVVLTNPVAAAIHDRFIIRRPSPAATVGGGEIRAISFGEYRPRKRDIVDQLRAYISAMGTVDPTSPEGIDREIEYVLAAEQKTGTYLKELSRRMSLPPEIVKESLSRLIANNEALALESDYYIGSDAYRSCFSDVESRIQKVCAEQHVLSIGINELRSGFDFPAPLWDRTQQDLERGELVAIRENRFVLKPSAAKLEDADRQLMDKLVALYEQAGFHSPRPEELPGMLHAPQQDIDRLLDYLCNEKRLVRLAKNVVLSYNHFKQAQDMVVRIIKEKGVLNSADFKYNIGSTRKYALAILDYLDSRRVTVRVQNDRKLAPDYQRYLL